MQWYASRINQTALSRSPYILILLIPKAAEFIVEPMLKKMWNTTHTANEAPASPFSSLSSLP